MTENTERQDPTPDPRMVALRRARNVERHAAWLEGRRRRSVAPPAPIPPDAARDDGKPDGAVRAQDRRGDPIMRAVAPDRSEARSGAAPVSPPPIPYLALALQWVGEVDHLVATTRSAWPEPEHRRLIETQTAALRDALRCALDLLGLSDEQVNGR